MAPFGTRPEFVSEFKFHRYVGSMMPRPMNAGQLFKAFLPTWARLHIQFLVCMTRLFIHPLDPHLQKYLNLNLWTSYVEASFCDLSLNFSKAFFRIGIYVMFPKPQHRPSLTSKLSGNVTIAPHVFCDFVSPKLLPWNFSVTIVVPMPKVSVTEHCYSHGCTCKIWTAQHVGIHLKRCASPGQNSAHFEVYSCPLAPDPRHDP